jgi:hypothetical protein
MEPAQVDKDVDQGVVVSNGLSVAELGALNPQGNGLTVDAFSGGPLFVDLLVDFTIPVNLIAQAGTDAGRDSRGTTALGPLLVYDGADLACFFWEEQGADVPATLVGDEGGLGPEGVPERHRQSGLAQRQASLIEGELVTPRLAKGTAAKAFSQAA